MILLLENGSVAVVEGIDADGRARYWLSEGGDVVRESELAGLLAQAQGQVAVPGVAARGRDARIDEFVRPYEQHWFWKNFRGMGRRIAEISCLGGRQRAGAGGHPVLDADLRPRDPGAVGADALGAVRRRADRRGG